MKEELIISGSGGQGIMFLGKIIALAALKQNLNVTLLPAYGAEVRGGTSNCSIVISDEGIASPIINSADTIIAMNAPSLGKFKNRLKTKGILIVNSSLAEDKESSNSWEIYLPFSDIATELSDIKVANMVALGAYIAAKKVISFKSAIDALKESIPAEKRDLLSLNEKALKEGIKLDSRCWILDSRREQKRVSSIEKRGSKK
jgi:2-oxoglutarate ferredoxin oxidoreductase subunit gamma